MFQPANIEVFFAMNSPDDSLLATVLGALRVISIRFRQIINFYTSFQILHLFASLTRKE